jgi:Golgi phosphoprotein 3 (GPP34)
MDTLGEDLFLLSFKPGKGTLYHVVAPSLDFGLMGSELIRLAAAGRVSVSSDGASSDGASSANDSNKISVLSEEPTGDLNLDTALANLTAAGGPSNVRQWTRHPRPGIRMAYLNPLVAAGTVVEKPARRGVAQFAVADEPRLSRVRAILDAVAHSSGPVDVASAAYVGLAAEIGLPVELYTASISIIARFRAAAADQLPVDGESAQDTSLRAAISAASDGVWSAGLQRASASPTGFRGTLIQEATPLY